MQQLFEDLPDALDNTVLIAQRCNLTLSLGKPQLPDYPTPLINGSPMPIEEYFRQESHAGLERRLNERFPSVAERDLVRADYHQRLDHEISTIIRMGFPGYFLIVGDFIQWAKNHHCPVGPGRGSGAGSLVAYALGITDLDPIQYNLLFERFLNPERVSMPDFDIDFCQANRDRVIDYVKSKYGSTAVSQIVTFGTMAARAAIRDVGRVLDMSYTFCDGISKLIPNKPGLAMTIAKAMEVEPEITTFISPEIELTLQHIRLDKSYITKLNDIIIQEIKTTGFINLSLLINKVHSICPELKDYCETNKDKFKVTSVRDKGLIGKIVEFYLFGNLPNSYSCPDTPYGDIKTTHFKSCGSMTKAFNAKERLTLTNFGDPNKEENIALISDKNSIQETKFYEKICSGIILVLQHDNEIYSTIESIYNKKIIAILHYDMNNIFEKYTDIANIFQEDFNKIKKCIIEKNVTQSGQKYLHIHKHGSKDSLTRAFGFTNKFLTKLVSIYLNIPISSKGKSEYIEF